MIYLLLSILCSSMLSLVMRFSEGRVKSKIAMLAANYLTCIIMSCCFIGFGNLLPDHESFGVTLGLGALNGVFFMSALLSMQFCIQRSGVVLPSIYSKIGALLVPLLVSILLFGEMPSIFQFIGFVLAVPSIFLMNYSKDRGASGSRALLMLLFLMEGCASSMSKVYRELGDGALSDHFLLFTFGSAFLLCGVLLLLRRERPGIPEMIFGVMIGVPNFMATRFMLSALQALPAVVVYPSRSIGTIVVITLAGLFLFRERLNKRQVAAMLIILVALALLNL